MGSKRSFDSILQEFRDKSENTTELGDKLEVLTKEFLMADLQYKGRFNKVELWKNWKYRSSVSVRGTDIGVDLVAEEKDGSWCAIQCKCYDEKGNLNYEKLSTFFSTTSLIAKRHKKNVNTILVYTGDRTSPEADKAIQINKCHKIGRDDFRNSSIIWDDYPKLKVRKPYELKPHQARAKKDVLNGLSTADRGKLIMACGTGKTLTALRIAEKYVGTGRTVLYLVPSISLIHQTMREWSHHAKIKHYYAVVCSDKTVGEDEDGDLSQLALTPTTDVKELRKQFGKKPKDAMAVVFSTYHSIDVASKAIDGSFDLVLCDEAHRTTGAEKELSLDLKHFVKVHHEKYVRAKKRLYMTATERVYGEAVRNKANIIHSMDDAHTFGEVFHEYSFGDAVRDDQLTDFKVRIPVIPEEDLKMYTNESIEDESDDDGTIDERVLLSAVWHALNYDDSERRPLLQRVISFSNKIQASKQFAGFYEESDATQDEERYINFQKKKEGEDRIGENRSFLSTVDKYEQTSDHRTGNTVSVRHVDGAMRASIRSTKMDWLRESGDNPNECRILSNARCLSEGVDVPTLDAVIFLQPRKSKVDVVQSVGRVMRKAENKEYGYVILPVVIPRGKTFEWTLHDNKAWKMVWQVLNALRSHNEDLGSKINRVALDRGQGGGSSLENVEIIWMGSHHKAAQEHEMFGKLLTKMVEKVGDRTYFDERAKDLGKKADDIREIISSSYDDGHPRIVESVDSLTSGLRHILHESISHKTAIDTLAQHHAIKQVFDALFPEEFRSSNPVATALDEAVSKIGLRKELEKFEPFYEDVREEAAKFQHQEGKQNYIKKIYGNFMHGFDKKRQKSEGIVYTPEVIIDFIIHSVSHVLKSEFGKSYESPDVKIFDPFTGTGAFIAKLLESGLIRENLKTKYKRDIWANENSLLAYYVAAVNIEATYKKVSGSKGHLSFDNINFTDTLNHNPRYRLESRHRQKAARLDGSMEKVRENVARGNWQHIHIILGNPPWSMGQSNYNDQKHRMKYSELDKRIEGTYLEKSQTTGAKNSLYDSYIRSIRWASDRIGNSGIIGFVTNGSFITSPTTDGVRACLKDEFSDIWIFYLRGDPKKQGDGRNVFEDPGKDAGGTKSAVTIIVLVKNPKKPKGTIHYKAIEEECHYGRDKRERIGKLGSLAGIKDWEIIKPDKHNDWVDHRNDGFSKYLPLGMQRAKTGNDHAIFRLYSRGVGTGRDAWAYNSSRKIVEHNMKRHIDYCNKQDPSNPVFDSKKAKWDSHLTRKLLKNKPVYSKNKIRLAMYRPFFTQWLYFDKTYNQEQPPFFPKNDSENLVIIVPDKGMGEKFSILVTDITPDLHLIAQCQCFPLYIYKEGNRQENITDQTLKEYQKHYSNPKITKRQIFEYVYGLLHHPKYRTKFANNLSRELPHIPMAPDFWAFRDVGKSLINLHLHYETGTKYDLGKPKFSPKKFMELSFGSKQLTKDDKSKTVPDKSVICGDDKNVIFEKLPDVKYRINGRTTIEWLVDKYKHDLDEDSGIVNDPLAEMTGQEVIDLIRRLVHIGVESDRLIASLPKEFEPKNWKPKKTGMDKWVGGSAQTRL